MHAIVLQRYIAPRICFQSLGGEPDNILRSTWSCLIWVARATSLVLFVFDARRIPDLGDLDKQGDYSYLWIFMAKTEARGALKKIHVNRPGREEPGRRSSTTATEHMETSARKSSPAKSLSCKVSWIRTSHNLLLSIKISSRLLLANTPFWPSHTKIHQRRNKEYERNFGTGRTYVSDGFTLGKRHGIEELEYLLEIPLTVSVPVTLFAKIYIDIMHMPLA